jgi:hypothetical protein
MTRKAKAGVLLLGLAGLLGGCDKLKRERFEMIRVQVDAKGDVEKLIGPPDYKLPAQWHYERDDQHLIVRVDFDDNGVVTRKQWIDAMAARWDDSQSPDKQPASESTTIKTRKTDD